MERANSLTGWRNRTVSRRTLLRAGGVAAAGSAAIALGACGGDDDSSKLTNTTTREPVIGALEQQKQRRFGTGLIGWNPDKTFDGLTLFSTSLGTSIFVADMNGTIINRWDITEPGDAAVVWVAELLENGNLFVIVHEPAGDAPLLVFKGGIIKELDWDGNVVWQFDDSAQHHDASLLPNGNLLILRGEPVPPDIVSRVQGGQPGTEAEAMWTDYVVEVTLDGEVVWEWHAWEHLDVDTDIINAQDMREEWTHANSIDQLPNGDLLISFRNISTVLIASRDSGEVTWKYSQPNVAQQNDAHMLPNGNVLIYDNGAHRENSALPFSRVVEVNPKTDDTMWEYTDPTLFNFFSPFISGAQRLENGNTLITEGNFGRIFEITSDGELVWEYVSPFFVNNAILGENNSVFRAFRYREDAFNRT